jgi:murein DD-endopeptidase MepM/ murein hydrolase activator NlpD
MPQSAGRRGVSQGTRLTTKFPEDLMRRLPPCKQPSAGFVIQFASTFGLVYAVLLGLLTIALEQTHREVPQIEVLLTTIAARVSETKADLGQYKPRLQEAATRPQQPRTNQDTAVSEIDRLLSKSGELNQKYSASEIWPQWSIPALKLVTLITPEDELSGSDTLHPEAMITDTAPEPEPEASGVTEPGRPGISEFARVLAAAGLNIQRLFSQLGLNRAAGGPFVPLRKGPLSGTEPDKLDGIRDLIKSLPLSVPLRYFRLESRFGPRRDPFNRRPAFHTGLDLSAPYMSPIYATAAGIVTYAGYRSGYGRVVEIDHGNAISTVYGHMHHYMVSVGQRVSEHAQIGALGSTGRSSGPHVHYEILVNGEPQDPERFIALAPLMSVTEK